MGEPFAVKDYALISIATGEEARNLHEPSDRSETIHLREYLTLILATLHESVERIKL